MNLDVGWRLPFDLTTVVADALCASADDTGIHLTRRDATRLADNLDVLGYEVKASHDDRRRHRLRRRQ
jgi:hypothetical protein